MCCHLCVNVGWDVPVHTCRPAPMQLSLASSPDSYPCALPCQMAQVIRTAYASEKADSSGLELQLVRTWCTSLRRGFRASLKARATLCCTAKWCSLRRPTSVAVLDDLHKGLGMAGDRPEFLSASSRHISPGYEHLSISRPTHCATSRRSLQAILTAQSTQCH